MLPKDSILEFMKQATKKNIWLNGATQKEKPKPTEIRATIREELKENLNLHKNQTTMNKTGLPPLAPKPTTSQTPQANDQPKTNVTMFKRFFDDNVLLINPIVDCSNKELHQRNGFKPIASSLMAFYKKGEENAMPSFKPDQFASLRKNN